MLHFYRRLINLHTRDPILAKGDYVPFHADTQVIVFFREHAGQRLLVAVNLTHKPCHVARTIPDGTILVSTLPEREGEHVTGTLGMGGDEGVIIGVEPEARDRGQPGTPAPSPTQAGEGPGAHRRPGHEGKTP